MADATCAPCRWWWVDCPTPTVTTPPLALARRASGLALPTSGPSLSRLPPGQDVGVAHVRDEELSALDVYPAGRYLLRVRDVRLDHHVTRAERGGAERAAPGRARERA
eukprot:3084109-Rhodomonas_salina.1